jgi:hypothetical protein
MAAMRTQQRNKPRPAPWTAAKGSGVHNNDGTKFDQIVLVIIERAIFDPRIRPAFAICSECALQHVRGEFCQPKFKQRFDALADNSQNS